MARVIDETEQVDLAGAPDWFVETIERMSRDYPGVLRGNIAWAERELANATSFEERIGLTYSLAVYKRQLRELEPPKQRTSTYKGTSPIAKIKSSVDIIDVISRYTKLTGRGTQYYGCCPLHDDRHASLSVDSGKQLWHCFGCGKGGDVIDFIKLVEKVDTREAIKLLNIRESVIRYIAAI